MLEPGDDVGDGVAHPKRIGFLSFGAWHPGGGLTDGAFVRVHHFARQLASPFPLLAAIGVKTSRIEIGAWSGYLHEFGGNATRAEQTVADTDFDSPLMRLAAGGRTD